MKKIFLLLLPALFIIGCASDSAEKYKAAAEESLVKNDIPQAVKVYENLINEFPDHEYTREALYKVAELYQNKLVPGVDPMQSFEKASDYFKLVEERFPSSEKAPVALFMAAYIKANELKNYRQATELYNLFLKKYPKHELAPSASQELEIMGRSPDEVLKEKTASGV